MALPCRLVIVCALMWVVSASVRADEGMWLLNKPPTKVWQERYGFDATPGWLEHVQKSCIRIGAGGSGSFVSPDGLLMTNHHVASDAIADLSDKEHDYVRDGFYARTRREELKCKQMELAILMKIEEVTDRVNAAVKPGMSPGDALAARRGAMADIEKDAKSRTGLEPEVVTLYNGGRYDLYLYKKYTDVRLVFAPESGIAFFGGDADNFEYPRFNLDCCFLRAYEDDQPARIEHYLKWNVDGPKEGDAIFVAGHPGKTQRLHTVAHLEFLRDVYYPLYLAAYNQREVTLQQFALRSAENARIAKEDLLYIQNGRKAVNGIHAGLMDAALFRRKAAEEKALRDFVASDPKRREKLGRAWDDLSRAIGEIRAEYPAYLLMENRRTNLCQLYGIARHLLRASDERPKPDGERLDEYREANLSSLTNRLFSPAPIHDALEQVTLQDSLIRIGRILGGDHPIVRAALNGQDAATRAAELIKGTKLKDVALRKKLYEGGSSAVRASEDPMIKLAIALDPIARELRKHYEDRFEGVEREAYARIAEARFEMYGESVYPDATFTLRINDGTVKGYDEVGGRAPAITTFAGLYERAQEHGETPPFDLPKRWIERKNKLNLNAPFNFISTNDIIGGNSGSPMFDKEARITGLVFDGNIPGLIWDLQFDMVKGRAVGVHSKAIIEALRKVFDAGPLVEEILGARQSVSRSAK